MKEKFLYVAPKCDEFVVTLEGVIATSAPEFGDGGDLDLFFG